MPVEELKKEGMAKVKEISQHREGRAKELRKQGKKIMGYLCCYPPAELMTAAGLIPFRLSGSVKEPITKADTYVERNTCPFLRSCFDLSFKGWYDFLDGVVVPHTCDHLERTYPLWRFYFKFPYCHFLNIPHTMRLASYAFFKAELSEFKKGLEKFTGLEISSQSLEKAIELHNQNRNLVRALYEMRKPDPPLISGTEMMQVFMAVLSLPVTEGNELLTQVISEVKSRNDGPKKKPVRLLIWSSTLDDSDIMELFEFGANVVMDESCGGIRPYRGSVKLTADPLDGLADYYLNGITCARTFRQAVIGETKKDYKKDLQSRFGYLKDIIKKWNINGAILLLVRYCDPFAFEMPSLKDYLDSLGIPSTYIEYDYTQGALAPLRTRTEAFLETIA